MKLSWTPFVIVSTAFVATCADAFVPADTSARPSSALEARRQSFLFPSYRSFPTPSSFFREIDDCFGEMSDFFNGPLILRPSTAFLMRTSRLSDFAAMKQTRRPTYSINEDGDKIELIVNIPGAKTEDIDVQLEKGGRVVRLTGVSKIEEGGVEIESRFDKAFMLGRGEFDTNKITANLSEDVLTITAPKLKEVNKVRKISITQDFSSVPTDEPGNTAQSKQSMEEGTMQGGDVAMDEKKWPVKDFPY